MEDQAKDLRQLVRHHAQAAELDGAGRASRILVTGGKGGVGTTTLAVNLAVAIARMSRRVLLIDADLDGGNVVSHCEFPRCESRFPLPSTSLDDLISGRLSGEDALRLGPEGVRILPGVWGFDHGSHFAAGAHERLFQQFDSLARQTDLLIFDGGNGIHPLTQRLWSTADRVLLVATPQIDSVMDAYASMKVFAPRDGRARIHPVINRSTTPNQARDLQQRLQNAALRFLGLNISPLETIPVDSRIPAALSSGAPVVLAYPRAAATRQILRLADALSPARSLAPTPTAG